MMAAADFRKERGARRQDDAQQLTGILTLERQLKHAAYGRLGVVIQSLKVAERVSAGWSSQCR